MLSGKLCDDDDDDDGEDDDEGVCLVQIFVQIGSDICSSVFK